MAKLLASAMLLMAIVCANMAWGDILVEGFVFGTEDAAIQGYAIEDFEDTQLIECLSIHFSGNIQTPVTYQGQLPHVYDPATASNAGGLGGPFFNNTWDGQFALTNGGHGSGMPGNDWDFDFADMVEFEFSSPLRGFGIGLSNFQSLGGPSPLTDHELIINGNSWGLLESLTDWQPGVDVRNLYVSITATDDDNLNSIAFRNINGEDGLAFDKLAVSKIPEPSTIGCLFWSAVCILGQRRRSAGL